MTGVQTCALPIFTDEGDIKEGRRNWNLAVPTTQVHSYFLDTKELLFKPIPLPYTEVSKSNAYRGQIMR